MEIDVFQLCKRLNLGTPASKLQPITGGLMHQMFKLETTIGSYAIKILNPEIMKRPKALQNYLTSEIVAKVAFENGIPAIAALSLDGNPVQFIGGDHILVFNWVDGYVLPQSCVEHEQCMRIGSLLAQIHQLDFSYLHLHMKPSKGFAEQHWIHLIERGTVQELPWVKEMQVHLNDIKEWTALYQQASTHLYKNVVVSHRDLDQKNVLWENEKTPYIIDWEATGPINPTGELVSAALLWSGEGIESINRRSFNSFIEGYLEFGSVHKDDILSALHSAYQGRIEWLEFNIRRSLGEEVTRQEEQVLGVSETIKTIRDLTHFSQNMDIWCGWVD